MVERIQTECFERWIGQTVYREEIPSIGPHAHRILGIKRGTIINIDRDYKSNRLLYVTQWEAGVDWYTRSVELGENIAEHRRQGSPFDYGLHTLFEFDILVRGGLLETGTAGAFDEPQCHELVQSLPLYRTVLENPDLPWYAAEARG